MVVLCHPVLSQQPHTIAVLKLILLLKTSGSLFILDLILSLCFPTQTEPFITGMLLGNFCFLLEAVKVTKYTITVNMHPNLCTLGFFPGTTDLCKGYGWLLPLWKRGRLKYHEMNCVCYWLANVWNPFRKSSKVRGLNLTVGIFGTWIHFSAQIPMMQQKPAWAAFSRGIHPRTKAWGWNHVRRSPGSQTFGLLCCENDLVPLSEHRKISNVTSLDGCFVPVHLSAVNTQVYWLHCWWC